MTLQSFQWEHLALGAKTTSVDLVTVQECMLLLKLQCAAALCTHIYAYTLTHTQIATALMLELLLCIYVCRLEFTFNNNSKACTLIPCN